MLFNILQQVSGLISVYIKKDNNAVFLVKDNGCGIPAEILSKVFEPFYRNRDIVKSGAGLGLAIRDEIAQRLGGKIQLVNRLMNKQEIKQENLPYSLLG
ncbi:MAG: ATP-binding protein [gamma proteobacterium symbiont of Bathyaustriella thionipta]|nr:ATP-binding protein [gamma proteobacterium symbiont of Bathyaustriella thionipta]